MPEDNPLFTAIKKHSQTHFTNVCGVNRVLSKLDSVDAKELNDAMKDATITNRSIVLALADRDIVASIESFKRHRRGDCACES